MLLLYSSTVKYYLWFLFYNDITWSFIHRIENFGLVTLYNLLYIHRKSVISLSPCVFPFLCITLATRPCPAHTEVPKLLAACDLSTCL
jgi:hypothetical protein